MHREQSSYRDKHKRPCRWKWDDGDTSSNRLPCHRTHMDNANLLPGRDETGLPARQCDTWCMLCFQVCSSRRGTHLPLHFFPYAIIGTRNWLVQQLSKATPDVVYPHGLHHLALWATSVATQNYLPSKERVDFRTHQRNTREQTWYNTVRYSSTSIMYRRSCFKNTTHKGCQRLRTRHIGDGGVAYR